MNVMFKRMGATNGAILAAVVLVLASCTQPPGGGGGDGGGGAASGPKGPAPTDAALRASRGPFAIRQQSGNGSGFNNGTIYSPTDTSAGPFAAIVVVPGFISNKSSIEWYGPRLASWGFVVMTINTNSPTDFPAARSQQQLAALQWLANSSPVADITQKDNWGVMGWSMGGGGSLQSRSNPNVKAAVPLAAFNVGAGGGNNKPTLIVSCASDAVAGNGNTYYAATTAEKAQLTVSGGHFCVTNSNDTIGKYSVAWMKRFLDGDTRFDQFICDRPATGTYRNTCPLG
jgi:dienelactone hydrolase